MAKRKPRTDKQPGPTSAKPAAKPAALPDQRPAAKRPIAILSLAADCLLAAVALGMAVWAFSASGTRAVVTPPFVVRSAAAGEAEAAVRIDARNQVTVRGTPCPGVSAAVRELTSAGALGDVRIVASSDAPCATVAAFVEALRRGAADSVQVIISR